MSLFVGIDIGTTNIKAVLFDHERGVLAWATEKNRVLSDAEAGVRYDPEDLYRSAAACVAKVAAGASEISAVGVAGMAEAGLLLDETGRPLTAVLPWYDSRAEAQMAEVGRLLEPRGIYGKTGLISNPKHVLPKLRWFAEHRPDIYEAAAVWLSAPDYIVYRLTGIPATDYSLAGRTMCFDIGNRCWDEELISLSGGRNLLPPALPMGSRIGDMTDAAARETGLTGRPAVIAAGHDHVCSAWAADCTGSGYVCDSMGTSEALLGFTDRFLPDERSYRNGINQGCGRDGNYYWMANVPASGGSVEWFRRTVSAEHQTADPGSAGAGKSGLYYFPYLNGAGTPSVDGAMAGAFIGLRSHTGTGELLRAVYEGISFQTRWVLDVVEETMGKKVERLKVIGGATRNGVWMQTKADILGRRIECLPVHEVAAAAAAMLAARGIGCSTVCLSESGGEEEHRSFIPDPEGRDVQNRRYEVYRKLSDQLSAMYETIGKE